MVSLCSTAWLGPLYVDSIDTHLLLLPVLRQKGHTTRPVQKTVLLSTTGTHYFPDETLLYLDLILSLVRFKVHFKEIKDYGVYNKKSQATSGEAPVEDPRPPADS